MDVYIIFYCKKNNRKKKPRQKTKERRQAETNRLRRVPAKNIKGKKESPTFHTIVPVFPVRCFAFSPSLSLEKQKSQLY